MTTAERTENILRASKEARNSDTELYLIYMQKSGMALDPIQMQIFRNMPSMETISRIRRKLQEQGKYPASPEVEEARYRKYKETKEASVSPDVKAVERVLDNGDIILPDGRRVYG